MSYTRRGKKQKQIQNQPQTEAQLFGRTRKHKVMNQAHFITPGLYPDDYNMNINIWTLAIDVGKKNMGFAIYNRHSVKFGLFNIEEQIIINKLKGDMPSKRVKVLLKWFKNLIKEYNIVELVVEKQVKNNGIAMQIENVLLTLACENNINYKIYDPKNKFQYIPIEFVSEKKEHKKISIHYALNIIYNLGQNLDYFVSFSKKDDISDAICMAVMSREPSEETIKWMITDHTNNILLKDLTKPIKFNQLIIHKDTKNQQIENEEIKTKMKEEQLINWCINEFKKLCVENEIIDEKYKNVVKLLNNELSNDKSNQVN
jgi:Holliday junction resolvasome RuvABC endonuclease subunit